MNSSNTVTKDFRVTEVAGCPGGECYLIEADNSVFLWESGFPFSASRAKERIVSAIGDRQPDYMLISHAHYDHAGGAPYLKHQYSDTKVVCSALTAGIFERPGARKIMNDLNVEAAKEAGVVSCQEMVHDFHSDIVLDISNPGEESKICVNLIAIATPGHTRDMLCYYFEDIGLLLASETTGVIAGDVVNPTFITSYSQSLSAADKISEINPKSIMLPHYGLLAGDEVKAFPARSRAASESFADFVMAKHRNGMSDDEIVQTYMDEYYEKYIRQSEKQPYAAALMNAEAMIPRIIAELNGEQ